MLKCPVCGSDKILGKEDAFYCYDYEYDKLKIVNGQMIPHRTFHMLHGPFEDLESMDSDRVNLRRCFSNISSGVETRPGRYLDSTSRPEDWLA